VTVVCLDPGHGTAPDVAAQVERIGPGSATRKIKDGGGAAGEAAVALAIARRTRGELERRGYRVVMTRTGPGYRGGNVERAERCNRAHAALMVRIHADGAGDSSLHGVATLTPALRRGWTDDVYRPSLSAARLVQRALVRSTGATDRGVVFRADLTGFNWADVPVILVETGFLSNPAEARRLHDPGYRLRVARGLTDGVVAFAGP
jgi:N-acetylmuramoyl-L-alanine amidase